MQESATNNEDVANSDPHDAQDALAKLRAALSKMDLTPEQTQDDVALTTNRDRDLLDEVPPHHLEH